MASKSVNNKTEQKQKTALRFECNFCNLFLVSICRRKVWAQWAQSCDLRCGQRFSCDCEASNTAWQERNGSGSVNGKEEAKTVGPSQWQQQPMECYCNIPIHPRHKQSSYKPKRTVESVAQDARTRAASWTVSRQPRNHQTHVFTNREVNIIDGRRFVRSRSFLQDWLLADKYLAKPKRRKWSTCFTKNECTPTYLCGWCWHPTPNPLHFLQVECKCHLWGKWAGLGTRTDCRGPLIEWRPQCHLQGRQCVCRCRRWPRSAIAPIASSSTRKLSTCSIALLERHECDAWKGKRRYKWELQSNWNCSSTAAAHSSSVWHWKLKMPKPKVFETLTWAGSTFTTDMRNQTVFGGTAPCAVHENGVPCHGQRQANLWAKKVKVASTIDIGRGFSNSSTKLRHQPVQPQMNNSSQDALSAPSVFLPQASDIWSTLQRCIFQQLHPSHHCDAGVGPRNIRQCRNGGARREESGSMAKFDASWPEHSACTKITEDQCVMSQF